MADHTHRTDLKSLGREKKSFYLCAVTKPLEEGQAACAITGGQKPERPDSCGGLPIDPKRIVLTPFLSMWLLSTGCQTNQEEQIQSSLLWEYIPSEETTGDLAHAQCETYKQKLYVFGGIREGAETQANSDLFRLHLNRKTWLKMPSVGGPPPLHQAVIEGMDGDLYVFGGQNSQGEDTNVLYAFDLDQERWIHVPQAEGLSPRKQASATRVGDGLIIFGGKAQKHIRNWGRFDTKSRNWTIFSTESTLEPRSSHIALALDATRLLIWGGFVLDQRKADGYIINLENGSVHYLPPTHHLPPLANARAVLQDDTVFIWGGVSPEGPSNRGARFHYKTNSWSLLPAIPDSRMATVKGAELSPWKGSGLLLYGGRFGSSDFNQDTWIFDFASRTWTQLHAGSHPPGRIAHCAIALGRDKLAVFGGIGYREGTQSLRQWSGAWVLRVGNP
jgi:N-acetylneuraminic acid mutarotase